MRQNMALSGITNFMPLDASLFTAGQPTEAQFTELAQAGVQVVINLALPSSDNALPDESATVSSLGMTYIHIPVVWETPRMTDLQQFMDAMEAQADKRILVHCAMNYRASAFTALWRVLRRGWETEKAFSAQRLIWNLAEYPHWQSFVAEALTSEG